MPYFPVLFTPFPYTIPLTTESPPIIPVYLPYPPILFLSPPYFSYIICLSTLLPLYRLCTNAAIPILYVWLPYSPYTNRLSTLCAIGFPPVGVVLPTGRGLISPIRISPPAPYWICPIGFALSIGLVLIPHPYPSLFFNFPRRQVGKAEKRSAGNQQKTNQYPTVAGKGQP